MLDVGVSYGIIDPERTASTDAASLLPLVAGCGREGGTHGGHEAAHG
jgi:hypothetical protein